MRLKSRKKGINLEWAHVTYWILFIVIEYSSALEKEPHAVPDFCFYWMSWLHEGQMILLSVSIDDFACKKDFKQLHEVASAVSSQDIKPLWLCWRHTFYSSITMWLALVVGCQTFRFNCDWVKTLILIQMYDTLINTKKQKNNNHVFLLQMPQRERTYLPVP